MKQFCFVWMFFMGLGLLPVQAQTSKTAWYEEGFDKVGEGFAWDIVNNGKILATVDKGNYTIYNKGNLEEQFKLNKNTASLAAFELQVVVKFMKHSNKGQVAGAYCLLNSQTMSGLFVELRSDKQFRVRKIVNGLNTNLTGNVKDGWISFDGLKKGEESNEIQLKVRDKKYELFLNQKLAYTFSEPSLSTGQMGLVVGGDARVAIDLFHIYVDKQAAAQVDTLASGNGQGSGDGGTVNTGDPLTEVIIRQRLQINDQKRIIDSLKAENTKLKPATVTGTAASQIAALRKENTRLKQDLYAARLKTDTLVRANTSLIAFRNNIKKAENGDLIIKLSEAIEAEKQKNAELNKKIETLDTDLRKYKFRIQDLEKELEELKQKSSGN